MKKQKNSEKLKALRHTTEHVLTQAMLKLYPRLKMAMGPATEEGFYFDFDYDGKISEEDFPKIEKEMKEIIKQDFPLRREELSVAEAKKIFKENEYKQEWLDEIKERGEKATVYWTGDKFVDLCSGPHVNSTGEIKAFKLLGVAGAYWRGDEKNKMLTRIYGTAFGIQKELDKYLWQLEEAKKRDHRKLGKDLDLFIFSEEVGLGLPLFTPKGTILYLEAKDFAFNTYLERGYVPVVTPHIASLKIWSHSGHTDFYKENLYAPFGIEGEQYMLKPMNCPFHVMIYKNKIRSYKELPIRYTEMGTVYRYERGGVLHGLTRVRGFTQDDAHIICTPEQVSDELLNAFNLTLYILKTFGFEEFDINLSVRDLENKEKFIGSDEDWERAENELKRVIRGSGFKDYVLDIGGAVFYGPKIDVKVADVVGRKWQLSTIQVDFNLPKRFAMTYIGPDGKEHKPFMIHRALLGSLERFLGILIEHYAGAFPVWLAPVQAVVIPVSDKYKHYAKSIQEELVKNKIRGESDQRQESMQAKIRDAQLQKIPYMLIVGDKEQKSDTAAVRLRTGEELGKLPLRKLIERIKSKIEEKDSNL